jgi:hypothetical protein
MDKGLKVTKWVLINRPRLPQMPQNLSAKIVCRNPKVWVFDEKMLHWASVVRGHGTIYGMKSRKIAKSYLVTPYLIIS